MQRVEPLLELALHFVQLGDLFVQRIPQLGTASPVLTLSPGAQLLGLRQIDQGAAMFANSVSQPALFATGLGGLLLKCRKGARLLVGGSHLREQLFSPCCLRRPVRVQGVPQG